jgi:hypothetical protein
MATTYATGDFYDPRTSESFLWEETFLRACRQRTIGVNDEKCKVCKDRFKCFTLYKEPEEFYVLYDVKVAENT